jgi:predicted GNAT family acetyltransferase
MDESNTLGAVWHDAAQHRFEMQGGAHLSYTPCLGFMDYDHTFVPDSMRGGGVASRLALAAFEHARGQGWRVKPSCSYLVLWLKKHPAYQDLVVG